jgi:hypothetical protein
MMFFEMLNQVMFPFSSVGTSDTCKLRFELTVILHVTIQRLLRRVALPAHIALEFLIRQFNSAFNKII